MSKHRTCEPCGKGAAQAPRAGRGGCDAHPKELRARHGEVRAGPDVGEDLRERREVLQPGVRRNRGPPESGAAAPEAHGVVPGQEGEDAAQDVRRQRRQEELRAARREEKEIMRWGFRGLWLLTQLLFSRREERVTTAAGNVAITWVVFAVRVLSAQLTWPSRRISEVDAGEPGPRTCGATDMRGMSGSMGSAKTKSTSNLSIIAEAKRARMRSCSRYHH